MSINLISLPSELLIKICQELPRPDLKSLRLTSSVLSSIAAQYLYSTLYLTTSLKSLQSFQHISDSAVLRKYVRALDYDPRTICSCEYEPPTIDSYEDWWEDHAGDFEPIDKMNRMKLLEHYPESKLKEYYARWLEYLEDEKRFTSTTYPQSILPSMISKCPNLTCVIQPAMLRRSRDLLPGVEYSDLSSFLSDSRFAQETLSGKSIVSNSISQPEPWSALEALHHAEKLSSLSAFDGVDLHLHNSESQDSLLPSELPALRKLGLIVVHKDRCRASNFMTLLSSCPGLLELRLVYRGHLFLQRDRRNLQLSCILLATQHWAGLRSLSLDHLRMTGLELRGLLSRHATSLRSLELHSIRLEPEVNAKGEEQTTSWLDIIEYLRHDISLTSMRFSGLLSNGRNEAWRVSEVALEESLKWRIQAYICGKGDNPIKRDPSRVLNPTQRAVEYDTRGREIPFIFEDETWSFSQVGLPVVPGPW
ncbi:hypothetical protein ONS95_006571 [Cadophora gregata]|uniref:uncharacterized protein n=1 Tax=Cadophora gregata TaxID=51156 RepID=UPI0026DB02F9|nr:uncharacterized protein ONS95_006571 [Cadophora gregata]KAK0101397.1 hypothetical protein ONS95_006571 [Cadophora gregata]KAK0106592.1 hypothetical protein ONS96_004213 [Cadophora gregata f. sp. sojae]